MGEERLTRLETKVDELVGGQTALRTEVVGLRRDVDGLRTDVDGLRTDVDGLRTDVDGLRTDVNDLRTDVNGLRTDVNDLRTDVNGLRTDVKELRTDVTGLRTDVDGLGVGFVDLKRHMLVLHEETMQAIRDLAPDLAPIRREFRAADEALREDINRRLDPLEHAVREQARRKRRR